MVERARRAGSVGLGLTVLLEDTAILAKLRTNEQIRVPTVRVIDQTGQQVGIIAIDEALRLAGQAGMDLVEVAPKENPPVCRIIDYGKWRYQRQKKEQQSRRKQHVQELKELRVRPKTDRHDLAIKLGRARGFLTEGSKVQFTMIFRGRERLHRDIGVGIFRNIAGELDEVAKIEQHGRFEGRRMIMILAPRTKPGLAKTAVSGQGVGQSSSTSPQEGPPSPDKILAPRTEPGSAKGAVSGQGVGQSSSTSPQEGPPSPDKTGAVPPQVTTSPEGDTGDA